MRANSPAVLIMLISILAIGIIVTIIGFLTEDFSFLSPSSLDFLTMNSGSLQEAQMNCMIGKAELETGLPISALASTLIAIRFLYKRRESS